MGIRRFFKNFQSYPEDLGVMLEFWYTNSELLLHILTGCPHSKAPQARSVVEISEPRGEREWELKKPVHSEKVFATRRWDWYQSNTWQRITVKTINTVKQPSRSSHHSIQCFIPFTGQELMNSINLPASSVWVFIAQLGEHCSANEEATGSNPIEALKIFFSGYFRNCLNCDSLRWSYTHFVLFLWKICFLNPHVLGA